MNVFVERGYIVDPLPLRLTPEAWQAFVIITKRNENKTARVVSSKMFSAEAPVFASKAEALNSAVDYATAMIANADCRLPE
jgi:ABC-type uncharacterized transport system auxiliary subunit